jgi:carboxylesterase type B
MIKFLARVGVLVALHLARSQTPTYTSTRWKAFATLAEGQIAGYRQPGGVATFLGIPYAEPPGD